jgi:hypothetical protein
MFIEGWTDVIIALVLFGAAVAFAYFLGTEE